MMMTTIMLVSASFLLLVTKYNFVSSFTHRVTTGVAHRTGVRLGASMGFENFAKTIQILVESHRESLAANMKLHEDAMKAKDDYIDLLKVEIMGMKGTLTCRGVLEAAANDVGVANGLGSRSSTSEDLSALKDAYSKYKKGERVGRRTYILISAWKEHVEMKRSNDPGKYYRDLYRELSKDIHGAKWSGPSVKHFFKKDQTEYLKIFKEICKSYNLNLGDFELKQQ